MTYKLVIKAMRRENQDAEQVRQNLANLFQKPVASMEIFFSGRAVTIKTGLDLETAQRIQITIRKTGADCVLVEEDTNQRPAARSSHRVVSNPVSQRQMDVTSVSGEAGPGNVDRIRIISEKPDDQYRQAQLSERFFAGWHTLIIAGVISSILGVFFVAVFCVYAKIMVGLAPNTSALRLEAESFYGGVLSIPVLISLVTILYATVFVPAKKGQTWGQARYNLQVVDKKGNEVADILRFGLRLLGNILTIVTYGIPQVVLNRVKEGYSLADVLSGTRLRQESAEAVDFDTPLLLKAIAVNAVCYLCFFMAKLWVESAITDRLAPASQSVVKTITSQARESKEKAAASYLRAKLAQECQEGDNDACDHLDRMSQPGGENQ